MEAYRDSRLSCLPLRGGEKQLRRQGLTDVDPIARDAANSVGRRHDGGGCSETQGIMVRVVFWKLHL